MLSSNLINKSYCFLNKQYSKEEYKKIIESVQLGSFERINELKVKLEELKNKTIRKAMEGNNNFKSSGNYLVNTKNCSRCFDLFEAEDCKYLTYGTKVKDSFDIYGAYPTTELCYEMTGVGEGSYNCRFGYAWQGFNMDYCYALFYNCNNCFGCNQLRNKSYCILNRQYTKEEYEALVPRIIKHMNDMPYIDKKGRVYKYGEFFPPELSPFAYNETIA
ncbi:hypothetical protein HYW53_02635, partial [Candidatus Giovannonibacteria bacterium]|nr:hypothetical protein [Candidatus Giovannonibacteria bacterium]